MTINRGTGHLGWSVNASPAGGGASGGPVRRQPHGNGNATCVSRKDVLASAAPREYPATTPSHRHHPTEGSAAMPSDRPIRVAIVGLGFGAEFIPIYQNYPGVEMYAVCRRNKAELHK